MLHLFYNLLPVVLHNLHIDLGNLLGDLQHVQGLLVVPHTPQCLGDDDDGLEVVLLQFDCLFAVIHRLLIFILFQSRLSSVGEEEKVLEKHFLLEWGRAGRYLVILQQCTSVILLGFLELSCPEGVVSELLHLIALLLPDLLLRFLVVDDSPAGDGLAASSEQGSLPPQSVLSGLLLNKLIYLLSGLL